MSIKDNKNNIILTGIPRSGTTLVCVLLNTYSNTIALNEPIDFCEFPLSLTREEAVIRISSIYLTTRLDLLSQKGAMSMQKNGVIPDNSLTSKKNLGLRSSELTRGNIQFNKALSPFFKLFIKHPAGFTALLSDLINSFVCFAMIRNPLSVLASWNTSTLPVSSGRIPEGEKFDKDLKKTLDFIDNSFDRQIYLLNWFFDKYATCLNPKQIIQYEEIIQTKGAIIREKLLPEADDKITQSLSPGLISRNSDYPEDIFMRLLKLLKDTPNSSPMWKFYSKSHVFSEAQNL